MIRATRGLAAGAAENSSAGFTHFRSARNDALGPGFRYCPGGWAHRNRRRKLHRSRPSADCWASCRRGGGNGVCLCRSPATDCRTVLPLFAACALALLSAFADGSGSWIGVGNVCFAGAGEKREQPGCDYRPRRAVGCFLERDVCPAGAEPWLRRKEFPLAAVARISHRRRVWLLLRGCRRARDRPSVELLGNDAGTSCRYRSGVWARLGAHRERLPLDVRVHQHGHFVSLPRRRYPRRGRGVRARQEGTRAKIKGGGSSDRHLRWAAVGMVGSAFARQQERQWYRKINLRRIQIGASVMLIFTRRKACCLSSCC